MIYVLIICWITLNLILCASLKLEYITDSIAPLYELPDHRMAFVSRNVNGIGVVIRGIRVIQLLSFPL